MMKEEPKKYYTYLMRCADGTYYCGYTDDIEKRAAAHNSGRGAKYTRTRLPVTPVYAEAFDTKKEAMSREWHIKRFSRRQKEELIASEQNLIQVGALLSP